MAKKLLIFAGPNGSGKSTLYRKLQSKYASLANLPLINPDDIAKELFGNFLPDGSKESNRQMLVAGKEALKQRKHLIGQNESFGFETTLSGNSEKINMKQLFEFEENKIFFGLGVYVPSGITFITNGWL